MVDRRSVEFQRLRFKRKLEFAESESAVHVGRPVREWELECVSRELSKGDIMLDCGCGVGKFSSEIARRNPYLGGIYGVDITEDMIEAARRRVRTGAFGSVKAWFTVGDFHELAFPDNFADVVLLRFALHHTYRPRELMREICRVLKPSGRVIIIEVQNFEDPSANRFFDELNRIREPADAHFYSRTELVTLVGEFFDGVSHEARSYDLCLEDWLTNYEEPAVTTEMMLRASTSIQRAFHLRRLGDGKHVIRLTNQCVVGVRPRGKTP